MINPHISHNRSILINKGTPTSNLGISSVLDPLQVTRMAFEIVYQPTKIFHLPNKVLILYKKYKSHIEASVCNTCSNVLNLGNPNCKKNHL